MRVKSIDEYLSTEKYYCIDFIPYNNEDEKFLEYEAYYEETKSDCFAKSIVEISLKSIYWKKCRIYLEGDMYDNKVLTKYQLDFDLSNIIKPNDIELIIKEIVKKDIGSLCIIFDELDSMLYIEGGLCVCFYSENDEFIAMMKQLANSEGLFVRYMINE